MRSEETFRFVLFGYGLTPKSTFFSVMSGRSQRILGVYQYCWVLTLLYSMTLYTYTTWVGFESKTSRFGAIHAYGTWLACARKHYD